MRMSSVSTHVPSLVSTKKGHITRKKGKSFFAMAEKQQAGAVTQMLRAAGDGDPKAAAELLPLVYSELRKLARVTTPSL